MRYSAIDLSRLIETAEPVAKPHSTRYCSDLASPLLKAQQQNDNVATKEPAPRTVVERPKRR
jgi:hypothetical protein